MGYRLTDAGRRAWESKDPTVPSDYRFILWLMDFHSGERLQTLVERFPEQRIADCLEELAQLGFLEKTAAQAAVPAAVAASAENAVAAELLSGDGLYLAEARVAARAPIGKPAAEIIVLIVEDDPDQLALADFRATMAGYTVWAAPSMRRLQEILAQKGPPDLLLLDVALPDGNGFDILEKLRRHRTYASLPIVMLTAKTDARYIERALRLGAEGYISKPYSKKILQRAVEIVLKPC
jgi:CheY-like chemotaxis protein